MNGVVECSPKIRELIAKAVRDADESHCPDGYADEHGFADYPWLSDWAAFVADRVALALEAENISLVPLQSCGACGKRYKSRKQLKRHAARTGHIIATSAEATE